MPDNNETTKKQATTKATKPATKKSTTAAAKKPAAKTAAKSTAKKTTATKKAAAKPAAKKTTAAKPAAKKPATKVAATKKASPKKAAATAKKSAPKKTAAKPAAKAEAKPEAKTAPKPSAAKPRAAAPKLVKIKKKSDKKKDKTKGGLKVKLTGIFKKKNKGEKKKKAAKLEPPKLTKSEAAKLKRKQMRAENKRRNANKDIIRRKKNITKRAIGSFVLSCGVFCATLLGFMAFGKLQPNAGLALRIDDYEVTESELTNYISTYTYYATYKKSLSNWQSFLSSYSLTPTTFRSQIITSQYKEKELIRRACDIEEIDVSDEEVDQHVQTLRDKFSSESDYKDALDKMGYTTDTYWDEVKLQLKKQILADKECPTDTPSDDDVVSYLSSYKSTYTGAKQSSHILISDKDKAQEVLDKINNGEITFENAVKQYSEDEATKNNGGDMGWDKCSSHVSGYDKALSEISQNEVGTTLAKCADGYHIIKCTNV